MFCSNCGTSCQEGTFYCTKCGNKLTNEFNQTMANDYQYNTVNSNQGTCELDDRLLRAYIGKNSDKILKCDGNSFSLPFFFFSSVYLCYRKFLPQGILLLMIHSCIAMYTNIIFTMLSSLLIIVGSVKFNEWYIKRVKEDIQKIKMESPSANEEQLIDRCSKKGGVSVVSSIVAYVIVVVAILFIEVLVAVFTNYKVVNCELTKESNSTFTVSARYYTTGEDYSNLKNYNYTLKTDLSSFTSSERDFLVKDITDNYDTSYKNDESVDYNIKTEGNFLIITVDIDLSELSATTVMELDDMILSYKNDMYGFYDSLELDGAVCTID